jgi:hypothetical protein
VREERERAKRVRARSEDRSRARARISASEARISVSSSESENQLSERSEKAPQARTSEASVFRGRRRTAENRTSGARLSFFPSEARRRRRQRSLVEFAEGRTRIGGRGKDLLERSEVTQRAASKDLFESAQGQTRSLQQSEKNSAAIEISEFFEGRRDDLNDARGSAAGRNGGRIIQERRPSIPSNA